MASSLVVGLEYEIPPRESSPSMLNHWYPHKLTSALIAGCRFTSCNHYHSFSFAPSFGYSKVRFLSFFFFSFMVSSNLTLTLNLLVHFLDS